MTNLKEQRVIALNIVTNLDDAMTSLSKLDDDLFPQKKAHTLTQGLMWARNAAIELERQAQRLVEAHEFTKKDRRY